MTSWANRKYMCMPRSNFGCNRFTLRGDRDGSKDDGEAAEDEEATV
jgi:hypothetical protein